MELPTIDRMCSGSSRFFVTPRRLSTGSAASENSKPEGGSACKKSGRKRSAKFRQAFRFSSLEDLSQVDSSEVVLQRSGAAASAWVLGFAGAGVQRERTDAVYISEHHPPPIVLSTDVETNRATRNHNLDSASLEIALV